MIGAEITIAGPRPLRGTVRVPGDKGISHRALLSAALASGRSTIRNLADGDDVQRTRAALEQLGVRVKDSGPSTVTVLGTGAEGLREPDAVIDCGNSGTTMRMLAGLLAGRPFLSVLSGDSSLAGRPMGRVARSLARTGRACRRARGRRACAPRDPGRRPHRSPDRARRRERRRSRRRWSSRACRPRAQPKSSSPRPAATTPSACSKRFERAVDTSRRPHDSDRDGGADSVRARRARGSVVGRAVRRGCLHHTGLVDRDRGRVPEPAPFRLRRRAAQHGRARRGPTDGGATRRARRPSRGRGLAPRRHDDRARRRDDRRDPGARGGGRVRGRAHRDPGHRRAAREGERPHRHDPAGARPDGRRRRDEPDALAIRGGKPRPAMFKSHGDHRIALAAAVAANAMPGESTVRGWHAVAVSYPRLRRRPRHGGGRERP